MTRRACGAIYFLLACLCPTYGECNNGASSRDNFELVQTKIDPAVTQELVDGVVEAAVEQVRAGAAPKDVARNAAHAAANGVKQIADLDEESTNPISSEISVAKQVVDKVMAEPEDVANLGEVTKVEMGDPFDVTAYAGGEVTWELIGNGHCQVADGDMGHNGFMPDVWLRGVTNPGWCEMGTDPSNPHEVTEDCLQKCKALCESQAANGCVGIVVGGVHANCVLELSSEAAVSVVRNAQEVVEAAKLAAKNWGEKPMIESYKDRNSGNKACTHDCSVAKADGDNGMSWWHKPASYCYKMTTGRPWKYVGPGQCQTADGDLGHNGFMPDVWFRRGYNGWCDGDLVTVSKDCLQKCMTLCESQAANGCVGIVAGGVHANCVLALSSEAAVNVVKNAPEVLDAASKAWKGKYPVPKVRSYNDRNSGNKACGENCAIAKADGDDGMAWWQNPPAYCFRMG